MDYDRVLERHRQLEASRLVTRIFAGLDCGKWARQFEDAESGRLGDALLLPFLSVAVIGLFALVATASLELASLIGA